ncbi:hypothetical protein CPC08DRAFT_770621 [Agrocybe pediades]|nr:hypothetical protein CPC08DRAFT_770621 [Agrocybe pediades]
MGAGVGIQCVELVDVISMSAINKYGISTSFSSFSKPTRVGPIPNVATSSTSKFHILLACGKRIYSTPDRRAAWWERVPLHAGPERTSTKHTRSGATG